MHYVWISPFVQFNLFTQKILIIGPIMQTYFGL